MVASVSGAASVTGIDAAALAFVPGLESGAQPLRAERLPGGSVNDVWRIDTSQGRFVLRIDGPAWRRPGVDRAQELALHTAAAAVGLAPRIVAHSRADGVMVSEFIDARCWSVTDYADATQLARLGERLAQVHRLPVPREVTTGFAPLALAQAYAAAVPAAGERAGYGEKLVAMVEISSRRISALKSPLAVVHGDPTHGNVLDRGRLWLIDWEYAQLADPVFDAAAVLVYYPQARAHRAQLLAAASLSGAVRDGRLADAARIHAALGWLWQQARGELPPLEAGISALEWAN